MPPWIVHKRTSEEDSFDSVVLEPIDGALPLFPKSGRYVFLEELKDIQSTVLNTCTYSTQ